MYFNSAEKGITPGDTWHARRVPGVASRCGGSRGAAHSESSREGLSRLGHAGHVAGSGASGEFSRLGTREHVSRSAAPGENITCWTRGALGASGRKYYSQRTRILRGKVSLAAHSESSGDTWRIRRLPG